METAEASLAIIVAVIGTGSIGTRHLHVLRRIDSVCPVAISQRSRRTQELATQNFATAENIGAVASMGATLCIIATDTGKHMQDGLAAVENGLDVLVEKPLSVDAAEGRRLCAAAVERGRRVFVGCCLRFSESLNTFRDLLGTIGRLHSVRIECQSYLPDWRPQRSYRESYSARADEGGVLRDLIHEIDYAGWLFGWPITLQAHVRNLGRLGIEADEAAELLWETPDGCVASVSLDYLSRPSRRSIRASGELGIIEWDGIKGTVTLALAGAPVQVIRSSQARDAMFLAQDHTFINTSRGIVDSRLATGEDGVKALAVCDAARRASDSRREERVKYL